MRLYKHPFPPQVFTHWVQHPLMMFFNFIIPSVFIICHSTLNKSFHLSPIYVFTHALVYVSKYLRRHPSPLELQPFCHLLPQESLRTSQSFHAVELPGVESWEGGRTGKSSQPQGIRNLFSKPKPVLSLEVWLSSLLFTS